MLENKEVIIRPADKGGAIVVLSKDYYYEELGNKLEDTNTSKTPSKSNRRVQGIAS